MNSTMFFTICSLFYSLLLIFLISSKKKNYKNNSERKLYNILVISNFIGIIIELLCVVTCRNYKKISFTNSVVLKLYLMYLLTWITTFTKYIFIISRRGRHNFEDVYKKINVVSIIIYFIITVLIFVLPMKYHVENNMVMYTYGKSVDMLYMFVEACVILCLLFMFTNPKSIKGTKYAPLFIFIAGGSAIMVLQSIHPEWLLMTAMETFITFLMYFTIESNDEAVKKLEKEKK